MAEQIPTGDSVSPVLLRYRIDIPDNQWLEDVVFGSALTATQVGAWEQVGTATTDEAADAMVDIYESIQLDFSQVGVVIPFAGSTSPGSQLLLCDGASYLRTDYPALFAVIGTTYGSADGTHFNIPDLRGRAVVGVGTGPGLSPYALADQGGEETHVLTTAESAAHSHTDLRHTHVESAAAPTAILIGVGAPAPSAIPAASVTGTGAANLTSIGGGGAHNNIQPYTALNYLIIAA